MLLDEDFGMLLSVLLCVAMCCYVLLCVLCSCFFFVILCNRSFFVCVCAGDDSSLFFS